ncbi:iron-containing alcohol dehydrogenase [Paenibacillus validus]|uniref:Iron-containing alcohol dehydrogenase n=1 Tax=Paenibacillus validus TaxID=44253 RepID=A0A7X2ZAA1_9BACL|nr:MULTISPECIES: iron-containing alcohol dehydrogenase [Paenibacillus]MED4599823.1 iron-containing alcohol dehydrogenase [Paenibacillus validus]MED4604647.1 iron-containing alcohol dehydrogenase [Paenibacillus validus]MUG70625.1 iron-containing alcohol dehydrogenase [Paenibacillus validus]
MTSIHQLLMPGKVLYGRGAFTQVGEQASLLGVKAFIISDPIMAKIGNVDLCIEHLNRYSFPYATYLNVDAEPTDVHVQEALEICRQEQCDVIIALGGGSCIDTAKAVAVFMTNEGHLSKYVGGKNRFRTKPIPLIAVPTTGGTGSEVTKVTVIIDTANDVKMMISDPALLPAIAIVDPLLSVSCPPAVTAATGIDALCHAVEAYLSRRSQPVTDLYALSAIELIMNHLHQAFIQGDDVEAREKLALGAMLAGAAFSNASVTLIHGMSRPVGALFHVPHGLSNAMLLPAVLDYTKSSAEERLAHIAQTMRLDTTGTAIPERADMTIDAIKKLCRSLRIPNINQWGIERDKWANAVHKMAFDALDSGSPANNLKIPTHEEIVQLYNTAYDYKFC